MTDVTQGNTASFTLAAGEQVYIKTAGAAVVKYGRLLPKSPSVVQLTSADSEVRYGPYPVEMLFEVSATTGTLTYSDSATVIQRLPDDGSDLSAKFNAVADALGAGTGNMSPDSIGEAVRLTVKSVDDVSALRATEPFYDGQQIELLGHTTAGIGGGVFYADFSDTTTADDNGVTIVTAGGKRWKRKLDGYVTPSMYGGKSGLDSSSAITAAYAHGLRVELDTDYSFTAISIPVSARTSGVGKLVGFTAAGAKPSFATLSAAANSAARLALLNTYTPNTVTLTGSGSMTGSLTIENALIAGSKTWTVKGDLTLAACSAHTVVLNALWSGRIDADDIISTDSIGDGLFAQRGGVISADSGIVMHTAGRSAHVQYGGTIFLNDGYATNSAPGNDSLFVNQGGNIAAARANVLDNGRIGANVIYSGSINLENAIIDGNSGAGVVAESNGAIYAEGATITNNSKGVSVSYSGFVQARGATITGNAGLAIDGLTGGVVSATNATIDGTNNSGGVQVLMKAYGYCFAEAPGTASSGKDLLTYDQYSPAYGVVGNGTAIIFDGDGTDYADYPSDKTGYSVNRHLVSRREVETISEGVITASSTYIKLAGEGGLADNLDTIIRDNDNPVDILILAAATSAVITIKHNTGNIRTADGASDIVLDSRARSTILIWNRDLSIWSQPKFS